MFFAIFKVFSNLKTWGRTWQCAPMTDFYRKVNKFFPKFAKCEMLFVCHLTILLKHCLQFLLGVKMAPSCIKPGLPRQPLCHKVNLLSCVARRPLCLKVNLLSCVACQPLCHKVNQPRRVIRSPAALFDHELWYFRHRTNEHFNSMLFIRKDL